MKPVRAGRRPVRAQLQVKGPETRDTYLQPNQDWITVGTFWAWVTPLQGNELLVAKQVQARATHKVEMRFQGTSVIISPLHRLVINGRVFGLFDVRNVEERNRKYLMTAYEIQTGGLV